MTRLEFLRRKQGLSQTELGERILYSRNIVSGLECGRIASEAINSRLKAALESYFGESLDVLLAPVGDALPLSETDAA